MKQGSARKLWKRFAAAAAVGLAATSVASGDGLRTGGGRPCPCPPYGGEQFYPHPVAPSQELPPPQRPEDQREGDADAPPAPSDQAPRIDPFDLMEPAAPSPEPFAPSPMATPSPTAGMLSGATGTPAAPGSPTPNMIGDTLGGSCGTAFFQDVIEGGVNHPNFASCSRQKIAENNSPMPRNRVYFGYNHFRNAINNFVIDEDGPGVLVSNSDTNVDRYTIGFEKTFLYDVFSLELRIPTVNQLGTSLFYDFRTPPSAPTDRDYQLGNISTALKALLYTNASGLAVSGGVLLETPTGEDVQIQTLDVYEENVDGLPGDEQITSDYRFRFDNEATFLSPFLAFLYAPEAPFFLQGFWQIDAPVHGAELSFDLRDTVNGVTNQLQDRVHFSGETSMRFDLGGGVYLYRDWTGCRSLSSLAFLIEAHYSTTVEDADLFSVDTPAFGNAVNPGRVPGAEILLGSVANRVDILNLTFGPTAIFRDGTSIATGFVVPTDSGEEEPFDYEVQVQINRFF